MHWYSWGGCEAQSSESKMPNRRSQLRSGLQLQPSICQSYSQCTTLQNSKWESFDIPTMRCNGQDNVTNIIMDLKKKKPFSIILQQKFRRLRKLTIECILVCASFQVPMPLKTIQSIYHKLFHSNIIIYPYLLFWWWWWTSTILVEFNLLYMSNLVQSTIQSVWSDFRFGSHSGKALKFSHSRIRSCCKVFAATGAKAPT